MKSIKKGTITIKQIDNHFGVYHQVEFIGLFGKLELYDLGQAISEILREEKECENCEKLKKLLRIQSNCRDQDIEELLKLKEVSHQEPTEEKEECPEGEHSKVFIPKNGTFCRTCGKILKRVKPETPKEETPSVEIVIAVEKELRKLGVEDRVTIAGRVWINAILNKLDEIHEIKH